MKPGNLKCPVCDKKVKKLNWHLRLSHGVDRNLKTTFNGFKHQCQICEKPFRDKGNLGRHMLSCQKKNSNDCKCSLCGKSFSSKKNKEIHIKDMHLAGKSCVK